MSKFNSPNFFPDELKNTDIVPVYKEDVNGKNNYQQISLLPINHFKNIWKYFLRTARDCC